jgi:hypothetical protein
MDHYSLKQIRSANLLIIDNRVYQKHKRIIGEANEQSKLNATQGIPANLQQIMMIVIGQVIRCPHQENVQCSLGIHGGPCLSAEVLHRREFATCQLQDSRGLLSPIICIYCYCFYGIHFEYPPSPGC